MKYRYVTVVFLLCLFVAMPYRADARHKGISQNYSLNIDDFSKSQLGSKVAKEIMDFFDDTERAIESKNIDALMMLYSDSYSNLGRDKKSVRLIWRKLFRTFDHVTMTHNMRFLTTNPKSKVMIIRCSGMLMGVPKGEKELIPVDSWMNSDHILSKEGKRWRIIGTSGQQKKRLWFDKPLHPLF